MALKTLLVLILLVSFTPSIFGGKSSKDQGKTGPSWAKSNKTTQKAPPKKVTNVIISRLPKGTFKNFEDLEQRVLSALRESSSNQTSKALKKQLETEINKTWKELPSLNAEVPVVLPIDFYRFFWFDLQARTQRFTGLSHTQVVGLSQDNRCSGDLIGDQLLYKFGIASSQIKSVKYHDEKNASDHYLAQIQRQVSCLSARQIVKIHAGIKQAYREIIQEMTKRGMTSLKKKITQQLAPVMLLLYDIIHDPSWFAENRELLTEWPTYRVKVLDRVTGRLVGFHVDLPLFLNSIIDQVGPDDCAMAGKIPLGVQILSDGRQRFICPTPCEQPNGQTQTGGATQGQTAVNTLNSLCRNQPFLSLQGVSISTPPPDSCLGEPVFEQEVLPQDAYLNCLLNAEGSSDPLQLIGLQGVPTGGRCLSLASDGDIFDTLTGIFDAIAGALGGGQGEESDGSETSGDTADSVTIAGTPPSDGSDAASVSLDRDGDGGTTTTITGADESNIPELMDAAQEALNDGTISQGEFDAIIADLFELASTGTLNDCASPGACSGGCNAAEQLLAATRQCDQQFIASLLSAAGMPARGHGTIVVNESGRPPVDPKKAKTTGDGSDPSDASSCNGPAGQDPSGGEGCGPVLCKNASQPAVGKVKTLKKANCCGGAIDAEALAALLAVNLDCYSANCTDETCTCLGGTTESQGGGSAPIRGGTGPTNPTTPPAMQINNPAGQQGVGNWIDRMVRGR